MERLTNSYGDMIGQIRRELLLTDLHAPEKLVLRYAEIPWFPGGQCSIHLVFDEAQRHYRLIKKHWNHLYDLPRFSSGVYNLDRLCMRTRIVHVSGSQQAVFENLIGSLTDVPDTLQRTGVIVLDGVDFELELHTATISKQYHWRSATDDLQVFEPLLSWLHALAGQDQ